MCVKGMTKPKRGGPPQRGYFPCEMSAFPNWGVVCSYVCIYPLTALCVYISSDRDLRCNFGQLESISSICILHSSHPPLWAKMALAAEDMTYEDLKEIVDGYLCRPCAAEVALQSCSCWSPNVVNLLASFVCYTKLFI